MPLYRSKVQMSLTADDATHFEEMRGAIEEDVEEHGGDLKLERLGYVLEESTDNGETWHRAESA